MPRLAGISKVLVLGSGGIVIGQAAEFDYSGSQALKALREEGIESILVNPNVATIQTGMRMADKVYLEPLTPEVVGQIIAKEKPEGILLGFGGQSALNVGIQLDRLGVLEREGVKVLGSPISTIDTTENRELFKQAMIKTGLPVPKSGSATTEEDALRVAEGIGYPVIVRVAYTLGGGGGGVVYGAEELADLASKALELSLDRQILVEEYLHNWKEIETEVVRDAYDNAVVVAALENLDPLGIHTGDSIVVAPTQTLTNREYQELRSASIGIVRAVGVVGECNVQFALDPKSERFHVIEVNARMSRSSALASKATGYPLAYVAAKLALGYRLSELSNKVTRVTSACFEPALDYIVVKAPRWDFKKFPGPVDRRLGVEMKSVGEVMAIGRSFEEALQKAVRGLEIGKIGLVGNPGDDGEEPLEDLRRSLSEPNDDRIFKIAKALKAGMEVEAIYKLTGIDPWYLHKIGNIVEMERRLRGLGKSTSRAQLRPVLAEAKRLGFSDRQIGGCLGRSERDVRGLRVRFGLKPSFKIIDTMAAEWASKTNYCYATYGDIEDDVNFASAKRKVLILGAGCIRIGSSVEFDYCTMNTAWSMKEEGVDEIIVLNNNPETVSTDYDMSDKLYFEEITLERVLDIVEAEKPLGVVVSVGGQTPNNLAIQLEEYGVQILGTKASSIDRAEDRSKFSSLLDMLEIPQPAWRMVSDLASATKWAGCLGYPILVRPSYVLSGAAMKVANSEEELVEYVREATEISPEHPVVISGFIEDAKEVEVDAVSDGREVLIGGVIEHVELAGTHSGDATMILPPQSITPSEVGRIGDYTRRIAQIVGIKGPFNVQFLVKDGVVYVIELNLRASRSMPFTSKCTGIPLIYLGGKVMLGKSLSEVLRGRKPERMDHVGVKSPTFSFLRLKGADPILGVEMNSTGEVACLDFDLAGAILKAFTASGFKIPPSKKYILLTVRGRDHPFALEVAKAAQDMGYPIMATEGTAEVLEKGGVEVVRLGKISEGLKSIPRIISAGDVGLVVNIPTPTKKATIDDSYTIRRVAVEFSVPVLTRMETALALVKALRERGGGVFHVKALNELHENSPWLSKI